MSSRLQLRCTDWQRYHKPPQRKLDSQLLYSTNQESVLLLIETLKLTGSNQDSGRIFRMTSDPYYFINAQLTSFSYFDELYQCPCLRTAVRIRRFYLDRSYSNSI